MYKFFLVVMLPFLGLAASAQVKKKPVAKKTPIVKKIVKPAVVSAKPINALDSASYAFGMSMGSGLKNGGLKSLNYDLLVKGLQDVFADQPALFSQEIAEQAINNMFKSVSQQKYAPAIAEGKAFLAANKAKQGVQTTASGLQYLVLTAGTGQKPTATDSVLVNYKGTLLSGKQFDSSYDRNEPITLTLDRVIPGWTEGMQLMPAGSKYRFFVPYQLAYGERGAGPDIPPYSTLIFEIELLKINGK